MLPEFLSLPLGTLSRVFIRSGPWSPDDAYYFALYFTTEGISEEDRKILSFFNNCIMFPMEKIPTYAPGEYRRTYRQALPIAPYFFLPPKVPADEVTRVTKIIDEALASYQKDFPNSHHE